ncbi:hypothetical protein LCGC14_2468510 [marine sediment metagenome]|uniref:Uncharacterized protein n=1 Tax=marine sediment metagenome TaxID=412755 RepID=A0A0F9BYW0_9ZZZZ
MAIRTNETDVKNVLSTNLTKPQIQAFIGDASLWVDEEIVGGTPTLGADRLKVIEKYLACALIRLRDLGLKAAKFDDINEQYQVDPDLTDYLTRAAAFDTTGAIRRAFLAPKDTRVVQHRFGTLYVDE